MNISEIVLYQRKYFESGKTRTLAFRLDALRKLQTALRENEDQINAAIMSDLHKSAFETYFTETGMVLDELSFHIKHLSKWSKQKHVKTPLAQFHSRSFIAPEPYGVALIMSPWNYPLQLCLEPLVGAISAGCCAVVKPSAYAPATSRTVAKLLSGIYPPEYIAVIEGGRRENCALLDETFDYIFFTGSVSVGKQVMAAASKHLTPVTLELGGKSPVIVDETANIPLAAARIAFGKVLNAGQTCVEPDYLFIHESVKDAFIKEYAASLERFFPNGDFSEYPHIINDKHYNRLINLIKKEKTVIGGDSDAATLCIKPTLLVDITPESPIMQEEIFGPILPVMTYTSLDDCIDYIRSRPKPLALYLFTSNKDTENKVLNTCSFGGGCINDTIIHLGNPRFGFGGVGYSGMGSYHGKLSFDTFTHYRSIVKKSTWYDLPLRYHPYTEKAFRLAKKLMK